MNKLSLSIAAVLLAATVGSVFAEEITAVKSSGDFMQAKKVTLADGVFTFKGKGTLESVAFIRVDPAKKYRISGEFRAKAGTGPARLYFGFEPCDAEGRRIRPQHIHKIPGSQTVTAADAKKGDKTLIVRRAAWNVKTPYSHVALHAEDDLRDLPNRDVVPVAPGGIQPEGDTLKITLDVPLRTDIPAGTKVRQHLDGDGYIYCAGKSFLKDQWEGRSGIVSGFTKDTRSDKQFWPGTVKVRILILVTGGNQDSVTEFRNIKVEEVQ